MNQTQVRPLFWLTTPFLVERSGGEGAETGKNAQENASDRHADSVGTHPRTASTQETVVEDFKPYLSAIQVCPLFFTESSPTNEFADLDIT